jgi:hypothetical protein
MKKNNKAVSQSKLKRYKKNLKRLSSKVTFSSDQKREAALRNKIIQDGLN